MRSDVSDGPGARDALLEAPAERRVGVRAPVLQVGAAEVEDLADRALFDVLLGQRHGGRATVVERDGGDDARLLRGLVHAARLFRGGREGLLADDVLARLGGGDRDLRVQVVGRRDVDHVDRRVVDHVAPRGREALPRVALGRGACEVIRGVDHDLLDRARRRRPEEHGHRGVGERVGLAHESATDHGDVDVLHVLPFVVQSDAPWGRPESDAPTARTSSATNVSRRTRPARTPALRSRRPAPRPRARSRGRREAS